MDALDARLHARRVFLISDIHGSIEPLLQLLIQSRLVSVHEHGRRQYVKWNDEECEDSAVVILGDLTDRHRNEKGSEGELKNEELRIVILIYHLNATHPRFKNAIISIIGNHDLNNLMLSPLVNRFSSQNCLNFCEKRYGEVRTNIEMTGRRKLFYGCNEILDTEKRKICEDIVVHGSWPSMPLFYKDFLQNYDVAAFFPEHKLLLVHGGIGDFRKSMRHPSKQALHDSIASNRLYLSNNTDFVVWAERVNEMSRCMIENRQRDPIVTAIVQDRSLAGNLVCTDGCIPELKGLALLGIGHTHQKSPNVTCGVIRADAGNNAKHACQKGVPCKYRIKAVLVQEGGAYIYRPQRVALTAVCRHDKYKHACMRCARVPQMWTENDIF